MPSMCKQQKEEIAQLLVAADDIGSAAASTIRGMGYEQLIQARERFKDMLTKFSSHYRIYEEDDNETV